MLRAYADERRRLLEVLDAIRRVRDGEAEVRLAGFTPPVEEEPPVTRARRERTTEYVVMWNVRPLAQAWSIKVNGYGPDWWQEIEGRPGELSQEVQDLKLSRERAFFFGIDRDVLILWTTDPAAVEKMATRVRAGRAEMASPTPTR